MLPLLFRRQRLQRLSYRGYRGASAPAVYASWGILPLPMQGLLPAGWLAFAGRESNPLDRYERFPSCYISSPFPGFILTLSAHDPGRVKTPKGRTQRGIVFYWPQFLEPSCPRPLDIGGWRRRSFYVCCVLKRFNTTKTQSGPSLCTRGRQLAATGRPSPSPPGTR